MKKPFDAAEAKQWLEYNPESGEFWWRKGKTAGKRAGSFDGRGYRQISLHRNVCKAHRMAWLMFYGEWPDGFIDHIDHNTDNNRIANLRVVDAVVNGQNQIKGQRRSSHGFLGVKARKDGRFEARIAVNGKRIALGSFGNPEAAHGAYLQAKRTLHAGCTI